MSSPSFIINNVASKLSILLLSSANANHTGTYSCLAFNPIGTAESSASLRVEGTEIENSYCHLHDFTCLDF